eukprot:2648069-Amphidinium_carterae.1
MAGSSSEVPCGKVWCDNQSTSFQILAGAASNLKTRRVSIKAQCLWHIDWVRTSRINRLTCVPSRTELIPRQSSGCLVSAADCVTCHTVGVLGKPLLLRAFPHWEGFVFDQWLNGKFCGGIDSIGLKGCRASRDQFGFSHARYTPISQGRHNTYNV